MGLSCPVTIAFGCGILLICGAATPELAVPALFSDHMVLQQGKRIPIWGAARPGETVLVEIGQRKARAVADDAGRWRATLRPLEAGGPYTMTVRSGSNSLAIQDVLVGEVWVCSGQSNMEWPLNLARDSEKEIAGANFPHIRLFTAPKVVAAEPQKSCGGQWAVCSPEIAANFSAVGYFFGRELHHELGVPVGLIDNSWGGTPAEAWTTRETLDADPDFQPILARWEEILAKYPEAKADYEKKLEEWKAAAEKAKEKGEAEPPKPMPPLGPEHPHRASGLYNGMVAPLTPFALRGVIWYQGESNVGRAYQYRKLFPAMIRDWRQAWGQGNFPFLFVQLANFMERVEEPQPSSEWAELREAQLMTLALENTAMAVTIDIGDAKDIHPRNKQDVGHRLALAALAKTYRKRVTYSGPIYKTMRIRGNEVRLSFDHVDGGLVAQGGPLKGFTIAGSDRKFVWAEARIEGRKVVVCSDAVPRPVAVRYAWANNPDCNLYNAAGLPASPFRTDDWPAVTQDKR